MISLILTAFLFLATPSISEMGKPELIYTTRYEPHYAHGKLIWKTVVEVEARNDMGKFKVLLVDSDDEPFIMINATNKINDEAINYAHELLRSL